MKFSNYDLPKCTEIVLTSAKSVDPDEMPHYAAFHLGLHCLQVSRIQRLSRWHAQILFVVGGQFENEVVNLRLTRIIVGKLHFERKSCKYDS